MNWLQSQAFNFVLGAVVGPLVYLLVRYLKNISAWIDDQGPAVKRTLVVAIAILVTAGMQLVGQPISCDTSALSSADCLGQITPEVMKALVTAGAAFFMHALKKQSPSS